MVEPASPNGASGGTARKAVNGSCSTTPTHAQPRLFFGLGTRMNLLVALCFSRVLYPPLAGKPQGEQLGLPPAVLPPWGWSIGFIATPRTVGLIPRQRLYPALPITRLLFCGLETAPIVAWQRRGIKRCSPVQKSDKKHKIFFLF